MDCKCPIFWIWCLHLQGNLNEEHPELWKRSESLQKRQWEQKTCALMSNSTSSCGLKESETFHEELELDCPEREMKMKMPRRRCILWFLTFQSPLSRSSKPKLWMNNRLFPDAMWSKKMYSTFVPHQCSFSFLSFVLHRWSTTFTYFSLDSFNNYD